MRARLLLLCLAGAFALVAACVVPIEGAPCDTDDNCPSGQFCVLGRCQIQCITVDTCASNGQTACDPDDAGTVGTCTDVGSGCLRLRKTSACSAPQACSSGACACPASTRADAGVLGMGCPANGLTFCQDSDTLLTCSDAGAGCLTWQPTSCRSSQLLCGPSGPRAACVCPAWTGGTLFVDPIDSAGRGSTVGPTGVQNPAECRLPTLGAALSLLVDGGRVEAIGYPIPSWQTNMAYAGNAAITPRTANGHQYRSLDAGTSGASEPAWPTDGGFVSDNTLTWVDFGADNVQLKAETFPITLPPNVLVTTSDCGIGGACDPRKYAIVLGSGSSSARTANVAVAVSAGGAMYGYSIINDDSRNAQPAATLATCASAGSFGLRNLRLIGSTARSTAAMPYGVIVPAGCTLDGRELFLGNFGSQAGGAGIWVNGGVATLRQSALGLSDAGEVMPNFVALNVTGGTLTAIGTVVADSTAQALLQTAGTSTLTASEVVANGVNGSPALEVDNAGAQLTLNNTFVHESSATGLAVSSGRAVLVGATDIGSNDGGGIVVNNGDLTVNGAIVDSNNGTGISLRSSTLEATALTVDNNLQFGVLLQSSTAAIDAGVIAGNVRDGLSVDDSSSATLFGPNVTNNGVGVVKASGVVCSGRIELDGGVLQGNGAHGLYVSGQAIVWGTQILQTGAPGQSPTPSGVAVTTPSTSTVASLFESVVVANTNGRGFDIPQTGSGGVVLDRSQVSSNTSTGIYASVVNASQSALLEIDNSSVHDNGGGGIVLNDPSPAVEGTLLFTLTGTNVYNNAVGGLLLGGHNGSIVTFTGNHLHANDGAQVKVDGPGLAAAWNLAGGSCSAGTRNQIDEYGGNLACTLQTGVAIANSLTGIHVDARDVTWANANPDAGVDWTLGTNATLNASPSCGAGGVTKCN